MLIYSRFCHFLVHFLQFSDTSHNLGMNVVIIRWLHRDTTNAKEGDKGCGMGTGTGGAGWGMGWRQGQGMGWGMGMGEEDRRKGDVRARGRETMGEWMTVDRGCPGNRGRRTCGQRDAGSGTTNAERRGGHRIGSDGMTGESTMREGGDNGEEHTH